MKIVKVNSRVRAAADDSATLLTRCCLAFVRRKLEYLGLLSQTDDLNTRKAVSFIFNFFNTMWLVCMRVKVTDFSVFNLYVVCLHYPNLFTRLRQNTGMTLNIHLSILMST